MIYRFKSQLIVMSSMSRNVISSSSTLFPVGISNIFVSAVIIFVNEVNKHFHFQFLLIAELIFLDRDSKRDFTFLELHITFEHKSCRMQSSLILKKPSFSVSRTHAQSSHHRHILGGS